MLRAGDCLGVAVSGGADSVALLAALREAAPGMGVTLAVVHVNHQLRGAASDGDQAFVEALAREAGLACHIRVAPVAEGLNVEQAAREGRRAFFHELVRERVVSRVATAHTADDQAETVLLRLLRGAGPGGLAGILPVTREGIVRPWLGVARAEVRAWAVERGLSWREDASNEDLGYARNRVRRDLMPQLEREWNAAVRPLLAQLADLARTDAAHLDELAAAADLLVENHGAWLLPIPALLALPEGLQGRVVRRAVENVKGGLQRIDYRHVAAVLELARAGEGDGRLQVPGVDVLRSFDWLRFAVWPGAVVHGETSGRNWSRAVAEGRVELPGGWGLELAVESGGGPRAYNKGTDWLDVRSIPLEELTVRNWRPGDGFCQALEEPPERVKHFFQRERVPLWERRNWPIIARKGDLLWVCGMGVAAGFQAVAETGGRWLTVRVRTWPSPAVNPRICLNQNGPGERLLD